MSASVETDLLIIGSGPVGAAVARVAHDASPELRITMIEAGPRLTTAVGRNVRNVADEAERERIRQGSQGPTAVGAGRAHPPGGIGQVEGTVTARQGTHLVDPEGGMPAAAVSTVVGGQGVHWTGATPRPLDSERVPFIAEPELDRLLDRAEQLLDVTDRAYPDSAPSLAVLHGLEEVFGSSLPADRRPRRLPVAALVQEDGTRRWSSSESILGHVATSARFELIAETLCTSLLFAGSRVAGAELIDRSTNRTRRLAARAVVVAADGLRTPQLLWASGLRPTALGRYLTEHPVLFGMVALRAELVAAEQRPGVPRALPSTEREPLGAMLSVPFAEPEHPFHAQIMVMGPAEQAPVPSGEPAQPRVILGWGCRKHPRPQDRVTFSDAHPDAFGMPKPSISYDLGPLELREIDLARRFQSQAAEALGPWVPGAGSHLAPAGTSLHYQGTVRMGTRDDGRSVCDPHGAVHGVGGLFVAGNGVIPTATACNPTLTSVALAIRTAERILAELPPTSTAGAGAEQARDGLPIGPPR